MRISNLLSNYARAFNVDKFWNSYKKARNNKGFLKEIYTLKYMRIASKDGGYIGRETKFKSAPCLPHGLHGIHISRNAVIGSNVTIFQNVTIAASGGVLPLSVTMF